MIDETAAKHALDAALKDLKAGSFSEAELLYRQILSHQPDRADALHGLALVAYQTGRHQDSELLFRRAIAADPGKAAYKSNLGAALLALGRPGEAIIALQEALKIDPRSPDAENNLGAAFLEAGQFDEAIAARRRALSLRPGFPEAQLGIGVAFLKMGNAAQAIVELQRAMSLRSAYFEAYQQLGAALLAARRIDQAIQVWLQATKIWPDDAESHFQLGNALRAKGEFDDAVVAYRRALELRPSFADVYDVLGAMFCDTDQFEAAIDAYRQALSIQPKFAAAYNNLGFVFSRLGRTEEAIEAYRNAVSLEPDLTKAHWNLAGALLCAGNFGEGFSEYEWRWKWNEFTSVKREFHRLRWDGGPLAAHRILLQAEQGFGDTIQFIRYAPMVAKRGGRVILECQPELHRLLESMPGIDKIVDAGAPLPDFDFYCPLLSLPLAFGTTLLDIPADVPYLHADPRLQDGWKAQLPSDGRLKVGLAWAGRAAHENERNRSISLSKFAPLAQIIGVHFVSLQKGTTAAETARAASELRLSDFTQQLLDFADTASLIAQLDLVITVDTAVAHLAGAMGKPVWVLLPFVPDWRWMLNREDSPWYPTMRLFRQRYIGDWGEPLERVGAALRQLAER